MVTLLYHGKLIAGVCRGVVEASGGKIQAIRDVNAGDYRETVIRWDSRFPTPYALKQFNSPEAVKLSRNKKASRMKLGGVCPPTWTSWLREKKLFTFPCLVRARRHFAAQKFYVCNNLREVETAISRCGYQKWYISPIIPKKKEYRVFCFQGRVIKVVRRFHSDPNQVAWNIANGGGSVRVSKKSWPISTCQAAILAGVRLKLDWYAADVILDPQDIPHVLELNTAPGLEQDKTFEMLARVFIWADENDKPSTGRGETWQELLHPALLKKKKVKKDGRGQSVSGTEAGGGGNDGNGETTETEAIHD